MIFTDMNNLFNCFNDIWNPFKEDELIVLDTSEVITAENQSCLGSLSEIPMKKISKLS